MDGGLFRFVSFRLICKYKPVVQETEEAVAMTDRARINGTVNNSLL